MSQTSIQNPLKSRRVTMGMRQEDIANRAQVTRQTVLDAEIGLYRKPPPSLLGALAWSDGDAERLIGDYHLWVRLRRKENHLSFSEYQVESFEEFANKIGGSVRGFCRALLVQRSMVQEYMRNGHYWDYIEACLWEVGLSGEFTQFLGSLPREDEK